MTARWIDGEEEGRTQEAAALLDIEDIDRADCVMFFAEQLGSANRGGGRHWEFGYGFAHAKLCIVVGPRETVFCHTPGVVVAEDLNAAIGALAVAEQIDHAESIGYQMDD